MESLMSLLSHVCEVVRSGRSFLCCIIVLMHSVPHPAYSSVPIRLNTGFRSDLAW